MRAVEARPAPRVSVLMFTCDLVRYVRRAVDSVLAQRLDCEWEIVLADDCSTDGTREIVVDYGRRHGDRIRLVLPERRLGNGGVPLFACAYGEARGEFVAYCDGDDRWTFDGKLARQIEHLEARPGCAISFHDCTVVGEDGRRSPVDYTPRWVRAVNGAETLWRQNYIASCSAVIRRSALPGLPDWYASVRWGDWARYLLAACRGDIAYIDEAWGEYTERAGGQWSGLSRVEQLRSSHEFLSAMRRRLGRPHTRGARAGLARVGVDLAEALWLAGRRGEARRRYLRSAPRLALAGGRGALARCLEVGRLLGGRAAGTRDEGGVA